VTVKKAVLKEQMNREQNDKNIAQNNNHDPYRQRGSSESKKNKRPINIVMNIA
jgi:hypothetical protein